MGRDRNDFSVAADISLLHQLGRATYLCDISTQWLLTEHVQAFVDACHRLPRMDVGTGADPNGIQAGMVYHVVERPVDSDLIVFILRILFCPRNLARLTRAHRHHIGQGNIVDKGLNVTFALYLLMTA